MTKVCHITTVHPRYDTRIFYKECISLQKHGYDVTLLVADGKPDEIKSDVKITSIKYQPGNRMSRILRAPKIALKEALEIDAEIYHLHDPELLTIALALKNKDKKVIFDSHENVADSILEKAWIPYSLRIIIKNLYISYAKRVLCKLDALITVTPHIANDLKRYNKNTMIITNYPIIHENTPHLQGTGSKNNIFVFAGGISEQWNHEVILSALAEVDAKYMLMGWADDNYSAILKKSKTWEEKVIYYGKVSKDKMEQMLPTATAGLALLDYNRNAGGHLGTLGNTKIFEYMAAGIPVICTDFILWKEIVVKWNCGICVDPKNTNEVLKAMQHILQHPTEALKMGQNGYNAVLHEYNWEKEELILLNFYKQIAYNNRR